MASFVFDIDGTLASLQHRLGFIKQQPKNWDAFFLAAKNDSLIRPVAEVLRALRQAGHRIVIVSGRSGCEEYRRILEQWLKENGIEYEALFMRDCGDTRPDDVVKRELYHGYVLPFLKEKPLAVFDDRKRVVDMWIEEGLFVFDVSQGKGDF